MTRLRSISFCFLFIAFCNIAKSQGISNKGRDFYVGYGHHQFMEPNVSPNNTQEMVLYFSAEQAANVTVTIRGMSTTVVQNYVVPANTVIASSLMPKNGPNDVRLYDPPPTFCPPGTCFGGEKIFNNSIRIQSDIPIVAYAHIYGSVSSGATMLLPVDSWGYSYTSINSEQVNAGGPGFSWVYAVAKEDNTVIRITPSAISRLGKPAGVPFDVTLQRGQIYQLVGQSDAGGNGVQFTGTTVKSIANASGNCYPIAVFSGSSRTRGESVPCGTGSGRDNDMQQCFPEQTWGKKYLTAPFSTASGPSSNVTLNASTFMTSVYKIAVKDPTTVVRRNGVVLTGLINGKYYQYSSNTADYLESDKPVMVAQFMSGSSTCNPGTWGDPEMVFLSPIEQAIKVVGFYRNTREQIHANYVTVIVPTGGLPSLRINGSNIFNHSYAHPNRAGFSVVVKGWQSAQTQAQMVCDSGFVATTYGLGSAESYAYNAGTYLKNLNAEPIIHNTNDTSSTQNIFTCTNTPMEISMLCAYKPSNIVWQLSQVASISPNTDITMSGPVPSDSVFQNGVWYYRYNLPGTYQFSDTGSIVIPVLNTHTSIDNCNNTEEILLEILVRKKPDANFNITHTGCVLDTVQFNSSASPGGGFTVDRWRWTYPDATQDSIQNPRKIFSTTGVQNIQLRVISTEGCVGDTILPITIFTKPTTSLGVTPASACIGSSVQFSDTSFYGGPAAINTWYWDYGNTITNSTANNTPFNYTYPAYGTYTAKHVVKVSNLCISDTATRIVNIYAKPVLGFSYPVGCLPVGNMAQFTSSTTVPDGQAIATYSWNFGDPNATPGNPNTSNLPNPTHTYSTFGNYTIQYSVTTVNGCQKDTTFNVTFGLRPTLAYAALPTVCESSSGTISVASGSVTNGVPGTGIYRGPGTDAAGNFNPSVAGYGTHTIWYVYTTTAGCADSISQTISVRAKPFAAFTAPTGCLPTNGQIAFTNNSTIADAQTLSYSWNFGDGSPLSTLQNPTHTYAAEGTYTIRLTVTTNNGCVKDTLITRAIGIRPALNYPALSPVCQSASGTVPVSTATVTNSIAGTGVYSGPGTDAAGNFSPSVAGAGTHTIKFVFTTNNGCKDSLTQTILVRAKPFAAFTAPTGCLPTNGQIAFTNNSTIADAQTLSYSWNFGDGSPVSTLQNPTHTYAAEGNYNISLAVATNNGCVKDTVIARPVSIRPALNYPALNAVCESGGIVNVATAVVTNAITGTGVYSGNGANANGSFNPATAGPGTHTIKYVFTTAGGCKDSVNQTIQVHPKPVAFFASPASICLDQAAILTSASTISTGSITGWYWSFGNGNTATNTNGNPFNYNYTTYGSYTIRHVVISDQGCTSDTLPRTINVHAIPVANFSLPASVCMPGAANFTNSTTIGDGATINYTWDFGDSSPAATTTNATHTYATGGSYTVTLTATSQFGCTHDTVKVMSAFFDKPVADFNVANRICQGTASSFSDQSTAPNSTVTAWTWNFDDGTSSTTQNPNKTFSTPGVYDVQLTVRNAQGCVSDPYSDQVTVVLQPVINAGPSFVVPQGTLVTFRPTVNDSTVTVFTWTPPFGLNNPNILRPVYTANADQTFTLTATVQGLCSATDIVEVNILKPVVVPNAFSPNGDGVNDTWDLTNLADYPGAVVEIYNRYGQLIYKSIGYTYPWDGKYNGTPVPVATYYYIIKLSNGYKPLQGSVTIVR